MRCLPPNFPRVELGTAVGSRTPGWYLANVDVAANNYAVILDHFGAPVWYLSGGDEPPHPRPRLRGLQRLSDGDLAWFPARDFPFGIEANTRFERVPLDASRLPQTYGIHDAADPDPDGGIQATNHHELLELPNGNVLVLSMPVSAILPSGPECIDTDGVPRTATRVAGARIVELNASGAPTGWEWNADVFGTGGTAAEQARRIPLSENSVPLCFINGSEYILGALHPNALAWRPGSETHPDQILMSARHADAIYAINYPSGEIAWKLGGTSRQGASLRVSRDRSPTMARQHDVRVLPNGDISIFDNRTSFSRMPAGESPPWRVTGPARYVQYRIDDVAGTARVIRTVDRVDGLGSGAMGSARLQDDGSVVLGWGSGPLPMFTEVNAANEVVFEVSFRIPDVFVPSYRVIKEPVGSFDRTALRQAAGGVRRVP